MIVKCVALGEQGDGAALKNSPWLTLGKEYLVLGIYMPFGESPKFRMFGDEAIPALHDASQFEVVSDYVPSDWKVHLMPNKLLLIEPGAWLAPGFWERYFDSDPAAVQIFEKGYRKLTDEQERQRFADDQAPGE